MTSVTLSAHPRERRLIGVVLGYAETALVDAWASVRRPADGRRLDLPGTFAVEVSNDLITRLTIGG